MTVAIAPSAGGLTDSDRFCLFFGINSSNSHFEINRALTPILTSKI
jgi:hypothetical protein